MKQEPTTSRTQAKRRASEWGGNYRRRSSSSGGFFSHNYKKNTDEIRANWARCYKTVVSALSRVEEWRESRGEITYRIVKTDKGVREMLKEIEEFLVPKKYQESRMILMGFSGDNISRYGEVSQVAITLPHDGTTYIVDLTVVPLADMFWTAAKPLLTDTHIEKILFDGRNIADYLIHVQHITLNGVYDLCVIEAMERCSVKTVKKLPRYEASNKEVDRRLFFDMELISKYYLGEEFVCCGGSDSIMDRHIGLDIKSVPNEHAVRWIVDHQRFLLKLNSKLDFARAIENRKYLKWFISSSRFVELFSLKSNRKFDKIESSWMIPNFILSFKGTEQPLGIIRCSLCDRLLPIREFSHDMICGVKDKACTTCLVILNDVFTRVDSKVVRKRVNVRELEIPADYIKSQHRRKSRSGSMGKIRN